MQLDLLLSAFEITEVNINAEQLLRPAHSLHNGMARKDGDPRTILPHQGQFGRRDRHSRLRHLLNRLFDAGLHFRRND